MVFLKLQLIAIVLFSDDTTDAVVITTRHNSHADFVMKGLEAKKHIFVEKPLCLTLEELSKIEAATILSIKRFNGWF
jgi:predicted dehydrogenase